MGFRAEGVLHRFEPAGLIVEIQSVLESAVALGQPSI